MYRTLTYYKLNILVVWIAKTEPHLKLLHNLSSLYYLQTFNKYYEGSLCFRHFYLFLLRNRKMQTSERPHIQLISIQNALYYMENLNTKAVLFFPNSILFKLQYQYLFLFNPENFYTLLWLSQLTQDNNKICHMTTVTQN